MFFQEQARQNEDLNGHRPSRRGYPFVAWTVIVLVIALSLALPRLAGDADSPRGVSHELQTRMLELQAKYLWGVSQIATPLDAGANEQILKQLQPQGPQHNHLRYVVMVGELKGPLAALDQLEDLRQMLQRWEVLLQAPEQRVWQQLQKLYSDYDRGHWSAPSLTEDDRLLLQSQLGWFGRLALAPADGPDKATRKSLLADAKMTVVGLFTAALMVLAVGGAGTVSLTILVGRLWYRKLRSRLQPNADGGGVYAEAFAVWLVLHLVLATAASVLPLPGPLLLKLAVAFSLGGAALFWPLLRGVSWSEMGRDLGLNRGQGFWVEVWSGLACYLATLPALLVSLAVVVLLISVQTRFAMGPGNPFRTLQPPSHPIGNWIAEGDWTARVLVIFLAVVAAPLVEETMFRGFLYRHLRDLTAKWRVLSSIGFSVLVNALIFALLHPQGMLGVPPLMTMAASFSLIRQWRDSLLAPMAAHAANNGLIATALLMVI